MIRKITAPAIWLLFAIHVTPKLILDETYGRKTFWRLLIIILKYLIVSPVFDPVTLDCYEESRDALNHVKEKFDIVGDLSGRSISRSEVEGALKKDPEINFAFWNHGSKDKLFGSETEAVIDLKNIALLGGREVFASACSFGAKGGVEAWRKDAKAVLCYKDVVIYTTDSKPEFCEAFNYPIKRRADGFNWKECLEKTKERMTEIIDELLKKGRALAAAALRHDRDILVCYTKDMPPEDTDCPARKLAIKIWGPKVGWRLSRAFPLSVAFFFLGLGILLHDYLHALWQVGGYAEILSLQGGYFGTIILVVGFMLAYYQIWSALKEKGEVKKLAG